MTKEQLEYYGQVYAFLDFHSKMFYLYANVSFKDLDTGSFVYSMDVDVQNKKHSVLTDVQLEVFKRAMRMLLFDENGDKLYEDDAPYLMALVEG